MIRLQDIAEMAGVSRTTVYKCHKRKYEKSFPEND